MAADKVQEFKSWRWRQPHEEIVLKTEDDVDLMRGACKLVSRTLAELARNIRPGVNTLQLDKIAEEFIRDNGGVPAFKGFPNPVAGGPAFPGSICTSINDIVVHGIPSEDDELQDGDIVSIDCAVRLEGFHGESCYTFCVGEVEENTLGLLRITKQALYEGIEVAIEERNVGDISAAIQFLCEFRRYGVVRQLAGHGIGQQLQEAPQVPNVGRRGTRQRLAEGMCLAIEPIVTLGKRNVAFMPDRWAVCTLDGEPAAHFGHTVVVRPGKAEVLTSFDEIEQIEGKLY